MGYAEQRIKGFIEALEKEAQRILQECVSERDYTHRTRNLYDSYGYGIYLRGKLVKKGYLSAEPTAENPRSWYGRTVKGREEIDAFLNSRYNPTNGIDLVVVAAMPYAAILESGSGRLKRPYRVISMSNAKLQQLSQQIKGSSVYNITAGHRNT